MSYQLVEQLQQKAVPVNQLCRVLEISRSGYYTACKRAQVQPTVCEASVHLKAAFAASGGAYGSRRLRTAVASRGIKIGLYRLRRLMRKNGLRSVWKRKFVHTTDSRHALPISPNVLNRQFNPTGPNQAWVADITYIRTRSGWLYLAVVLDLFSRQVIGWSMGSRIDTALVLNALLMALRRRRPKETVLVHSDQGCQFTGHEWQGFLRGHNLVSSMSRRGNCHDNAVAESFFQLLKRERIRRQIYLTRQDARADVFNYIEMFYNPRRRHSTAGDLSPIEFEKRHSQRLGGV